MSKTQFSMTIGRSLAVAALGSVLFLVAPANRIAKDLLPVPSPTVSPTPVPTPEVKRPNPVRRFFSSTFNKITGVFRRPEPFYCHLPPLVTLTSSSSSIAVCPPAQVSPTCSSSGEVTLTADVPGTQDNELLYTWGVTAGRLRNDGRKVTWDLNGVAEGTYTATVEVNAGNQLTSTGSTTVRVATCTDCVTRESPCPTVSVSCPATFESKQPMTFVATVSGGDPAVTATYQWSLTAGKLISGQGTSKIVVDVSNLARQSLTATVSVGGFPSLCASINVASCSVQIEH